MTSISEIKRAQKESLLFREISQLFRQTSLDDSRLRDLSVSRVELSSDKSVCTIYFYTDKGIAHFNEIIDVLKLYKPSLRKAIASQIRSKYVPELIFKFDSKYEKILKIEQLLDQVKEKENKE